MSLEQELKFSLPDRAAFEKALAFLGPAEAVLEQVNHYFSAPGGEVSANWSLRIRQEADCFELTLKSGRKQVEGYFEAREINHELTSEQAREMLASASWAPEWFTRWEPLRLLKEEFGVDQPLYIGSLRNLRHKCRKMDWGQPELDQTSFPDGSIDYELEVETDRPDAVRSALEPLAELLTVETKTKFRRFLERTRAL